MLVSNEPDFSSLTLIAENIDEDDSVNDLFGTSVDKSVIIDMIISV
jgi:hypothetical protein